MVIFYSYVSSPEGNYWTMAIEIVDVPYAIKMGKSNPL